MDVKFIMVDLQTCLRACLITGKSYEKRYHLKNLYAGMLEVYKLLYGFGKMRKYGLGTNRKIVAMCGSEKVEPVDFYTEIIVHYDDITSALQGIEATKADRDDRNLTFHYDDDLLLVYHLTLKTDSEEEAVLKYLKYLQIFDSILKFSLDLEPLFLEQAYLLPKGCGYDNNIGLMVIKKIADVFGNHSQMNKVLSEGIDSAARQLDEFAMRIL